MIKIFKKFKTASVELKATLSYTVCNILQRCMSFITLPLFTRLLTKEEYGQSSVFQSWESIAGIFISMYLAYGSFNRAMVKYEDRRDEYISSINGIVTVFGLLFLAIYLPFRDFFNGIFELPTILIVFMVIHIVLGNAISCWQAKNRFEFKYKPVIAQMLIMSVLSPLLSYILICLSDKKGEAKIIGGVLAVVILGGFIYIQSFIKGKKIFNKEFWKYALGFNIPLIPYYLSQVIFNQSDKIMIDKILGKDDVAVYGVAYNLALILNFVLNAINNSYVPWMYGRLKDGQTKKNQKIASLIAIIMAVLLLCIIIAAPEIILLMAGSAYAEAVYVVPPVAMSLLLLFYSQLFINVQFYFEAKKGMVAGTAIAAAANIVLNFIFIPIFGYVAAAYTTLVSYVLFAFLNYLSYKRLLKKNNVEDNLYNYKALIGIALAFMAIGFGFMLLYEFTIARIGIVLFGLAMLFVFRKEVMDIYRRYKDKEFYLKKTAQKKVPANRPIKVGFIVQMPEIWDKEYPVYRAMLDNKDFEPYLIVEQNMDYFSGFAADGNAIDAYKDGKLIDIKKLGFDYIFYQRPYNHYLPEEFRTNRVIRYAKTCYVPYAFWPFAGESLCGYNTDFYKNLYMGFLETEDCVQIISDRLNSKYNKLMYRGNPVFDDIECVKPKSYKNILWTPRWTYNEGVGGSHFLEYKDDFVELGKANDGKTVLRPHPLAFDNYISKGYMTESEVADFKSKLSDNGIILDPNKMISDTFADTDILITDISSVVIMFFLTGKPIIFCETDEAMVPAFEKIKEGMYVADNWEQVRTYYEKLKNGEDSLYEKRREIAMEILNDVKDSSDRILEELLKDSR